MRNDPTREAELALIEVFRASTDKHEANRRAAPILEQLTREPAFLTAVLANYLAAPGSLDRKNYPVVGMNVALNPYFGLVANCWIPLPGRETHISTKMIHHHGDMLLSTATLFGPGYEHWMFTMPKAIPGEPETFSMELLERAPHARHHVSFVDAWIAHTPVYPRSLSITLALWSSRFPVTWKDHVKRLSVFRGREDRLRKLALRFGGKRLALKVVESFDYYPVDRGFRVMRERKEFALGPNEDHLASVFSILQETGNERLVSNVRRLVGESRVGTAARPAVERFADMLDRGTPIEGRLSPGHYGVPNMNFTSDEIERSLRAVAVSTNNKGDIDGRKLATEAAGEAPARASSQ